MEKGRGFGLVEDLDEDWNWENVPGYENPDGHWRPIRVVFTRWRVPAPVAIESGYRYPNWNDFKGYEQDYRGRPPLRHDESPSFLQQCEHSPLDLRLGVANHFGRFLHKEEANLKPAGKSGHEYLEMYDKLVGRNWIENPRVMDFLNNEDHLPLIHIIVNISDRKSRWGSRGTFDLFFPHELHFGKIDSICYENDPHFSPEHEVVRYDSAVNSGACPECAKEMEHTDYDNFQGLNGVVHIVSKNRSKIHTDDIFGYRGFGQDITETMADPKRPGGIIIHLPTNFPKAGRIFMPRRIVHEVFGKNKRWSKMKIFPYPNHV